MIHFLCNVESSRIPSILLMVFVAVAIVVLEDIIYICFVVFLNNMDITI